MTETVGQFNAHNRGAKDLIEILYKSRYNTPIIQDRQIIDSAELL